MTITANSLAAAVAVGVKNTQFVSSAEVLQRKMLLVGTYDPLLTGTVDDQPVQILSPEDAGDRFGFGFMIHRLSIAAFKGGKGLPMFVIPQSDSGGTQSTGTITITTGTVESGTLWLYIAGDVVPVTVPALTSGSPTDQDDIATLIAAAVTADNDLPVTAAAVLGVVTFTAKSAALYGDDISVALNLGFGQVLPGGVTAVIVAMSGGAGTPDITTALDTGLGTGDAANDLGITDMVHGYGQVTTTLDAISAYVGAGNGFVGLYDKLVARPFRALTGDVATGSAGLTALIALTDTRLLDRANGVIAAPGSQSHPAEIAAQAMGHMGRINANRAEEHYLDVTLEGVWAGDNADQWTSDYDNRDTAVKSGISPTLFKNSVMTMQNVVSFYRPASVPVASNGYRSMRNISISQNILNAVKGNFEQEKWKGISVVADVNLVSNPTSKAKARDTGSVIDDLVSLAKSFGDRAWVFDPQFTIDALKETGAVTIRAGGVGFDSTVKVIYSGEGGILDTTVEFDTSLAAILG